MNSARRMTSRVEAYSPIANGAFLDNLVVKTIADKYGVVLIIKQKWHLELEHREQCTATVRFCWFKYN